RVSIEILFFFSSRRRHTRCLSDWSSDVCSSDLASARPAKAWPAIYAAANLACGAKRARSTTSSAKEQAAEWDWASQSAGIFSKRSEERRVGKERGGRQQREHTNKKQTHLRLAYQ